MSFRHGILFGVVAGCSTGPSGLDAASYLQQLAAADCAVEARCGLIGASEEKGCESSAAVDVPSYSPVEAVASRRLAFDSRLAQRCLSLDLARGCSADAHRAYLAECGAVFTARVAVGGSCLDSRECVGGYCEQVMSGSAGSCRPSPALGQRCDPEVDHCGGPARCDPISMTCVAEAVATQGALGDVCQIDLLGDSDCALGLYCDDSLPSPRCATPLQAGDACSTMFACADALTCAGLTFDPTTGAASSEGRCAPFSDVGGACDAGAYVSGCPFDQTCDATTRTCLAGQS